MATRDETSTTSADSLRSGPEGRTLVVRIAAPIGPADIVGLGECLRVLLEGSGAERVVCDVGPAVDPDAVAVHALAAIALVARRLGRTVHLGRACEDLRDLLNLCGLRDVLAPPGSGVEALRQAEQRKEPGGVQERMEPGDPAA